jgi:competence ComEA-like helix-hairpin-helix protein
MTGSGDARIRAWAFLTADAAFAVLLLLILTLAALRGVVEMGEESGFAAGPAGAPPASARALSPRGGLRRVDLNRANVDALASLPGIGPVRAAAIVRFRDTHGPFQRLGDLERIPEIGPTHSRQMRAYLTLGEGASWSTR